MKSFSRNTSDTSFFFDIFENGKFSPLIESAWIENEKKARTSNPNSIIHPFIAEILSANKIERIYLHQAQAIEKIFSGKNVIITTGTASGKSLCYQIPIIDSCLTDQNTSSLLIFPTKALGQDQYSKLLNLTQQFEIRKFINMLDGDTHRNKRTNIRNVSRIIITNPDMLHLSILPNHTKWHQFLRFLKYVVIDEIHIYRGVFGSHLTNIIRRLKRICSFYGSHPIFILTSATISNSHQFAERLIEENIHSVSDDASPVNEKRFYFVNPPVINPQLGIRRSMVDQSLEIANKLVEMEAQCILFARSRKTVEISLKKVQLKEKDRKDRVNGYRSGYLPEERRQIEAGIRDGRIKLTVSTNALELGIDMGKVDAIIMMGYPGSIASFLQQSGRAGRENQPSLSILVASLSPIDQYIIRNAHYIKNNNPEEALIDPNNRFILLDHIRCALQEIPFSEGESYGTLIWKDIYTILNRLIDDRLAIKRGSKYFWIANNNPAAKFTIRGIIDSPVQLLISENISIRKIGEVDFDSAQKIVYPGAVYLHNGNAYRVLSLDMDNHQCLLENHNDDFFTEPLINTDIQHEVGIKKRSINNGIIHFGDISVTEKITGYKKIDWLNNQILTTETLDLPEKTLNTKSFWMTLNEGMINQLRDNSLWLNDRIDYGKDWKQLRIRVLNRDEFQCRHCGNVCDPKILHIHHIVPFRSFKDISLANHLSNLITLCPTCHKIAEQNVRIRSGISGFAYLFAHLTPLFLMCDQHDLGYSSGSLSLGNGNLPAITIYDQHPGGIGLSEKLFEIAEKVIVASREVVTNCPCAGGCPACIGPSGENSNGSKAYTVSLIQMLAE